MSHHNIETIVFEPAQENAFDIMADHSSCKQWILTMESLASEQKWDQLHPLSCEDCPFQKNMMVYRPLKMIINQPDFTPKIKEAIHRMYGTITAQRWFEIMSCHGTSEALLRHLHQAGDLKDQSDLADYLLSSLYDFDRPFSDFLLEEIGLNINLLTVDGSPVLLSYLMDQIPPEYLNQIPEEDEDEDEKEEEEELDEIWLKELLCNVEFLLSRGADPLLYDKYGMSTLSFVETIKNDSLQSTLLALLQPYV